MVTYSVILRGAKRLRRISSRVLACALLALTIAPAAHAQQEVPIIVIRFNQPQVNFQTHLATLVEKARTVKPDVNFYLVNYVPPDAPIIDNMPQEVSSVGNSLIRLGVPKDNITYDRVYANVRTSEVHVFLR